MHEKFKCLRNKIKNETSFEDDGSDNQHSTENSFTEVFYSLNTLINIDACADVDADLNENENDIDGFGYIPSSITPKSNVSHKDEGRDSIDSPRLQRSSSFQTCQIGSSVLLSNQSSCQGVGLNQNMLSSNYYCPSSIGGISNLLSPINHPLIPRGDSEYTTKYDSLE